MTRVPPIGRDHRPSRSDDGPEESKEKKHKDEKKFKLPEKKEGAGEAIAQEKKLDTTEVAQTEKAEVKKAASVEANKMTNLSGILGRMVDSMQIGKVGGKDLLQAQLKETQNIPDAFKGAQVKIEMSPDGLKVFIEPLAGQQDQAQALIQQHQEQTLQLQQSLAAKGYVLQHLQVGDFVAELPKPKVTPLSELFSGSQAGREKGREEPKKVEPDREY